MNTLLPVLREIPEHGQQCDGSKCKKCPLHKVWCHGCGGSTTSCGTQERCLSQCMSCHGEPAVQGVCCKSPLAGEAVDRINTLGDLKYTKVERLEFPDERIPILLDRHHRSPAKVNSVSINRVFSLSRGWKSKDLKDYLQLDKSSKLILSTVMTDDHLMKLAEVEWWKTAPVVGIDYWEPMLWSMFVNESRLQRLLSFWRTMKSLSDTAAHIAPFTFQHTPALKISDELLRMHKAIPNVGVGLSHGSDSHEAQARTFGYVKKYAPLLGSRTAWFVQGLTSRVKRELFKSILPKGTRCYFFVTPITGRRLSNDQYGWYD